MNLKHLQTFYTLSQEKNFTKTAALLGCAQSNVTTQIRLLESELGVLLFERIGKHISLTPEGERLLPYAKKMLSLSAEIEVLYKHAGRLTIGITESIAGYLSGDILKEFLALYPDTEIFLKMLDGKDACEMLRNGEIDLAIVLDLPIKQNSILVMQSKKEPIILTAASTHELSGKNHISPSDFETYGVLLPLPGCPYRILLEQQLLSEGIRIKPVLETDSISVIKESSLCGIGLGLLPEFAVKKELIYHMLEKINYKTDFPIYMQILLHKDKWISPDLEHFLEIAKRHLM